MSISIGPNEVEKLHNEINTLIRDYTSVITLLQLLFKSLQKHPLLLVLLKLSGMPKKRVRRRDACSIQLVRVATTLLKVNNVQYRGSSSLVNRGR